jgi:hypothetical protein
VLTVIGICPKLAQTSLPARAVALPGEFGAELRGVWWRGSLPLRGGIRRAGPEPPGRLDSLLTDADLPLSLEAIEVLPQPSLKQQERSRPSPRPILGRIGPHNACRIEAAVPETAEMIAPGLGLALSVAAEPGPATEKGPGQSILPVEVPGRPNLIAHGISCRLG